MHLVMCGRIEHILEWAQRTYGLGMDPALVEQVELGVGEHVRGRHSQDGEGQVKHPGEETLQRGVPHAHSHGEVLAAMVDLVNGPQQHDLCEKNGKVCMDEC